MCKIVNCQTPKSVNNIPAINEIGGQLFSGVVTIVTETDSEVLINGQDISNFNATPQIVAGNPLFSSYTIEGLTGNVSIESTNQVYVASFGAYEYASFGGYYSGFAYKPEIVLDEIAVDSDQCIPNLELKLNSIATFDEYQWYFNGEIIEGKPSFIIRRLCIREGEVHRVDGELRNSNSKLLDAAQKVLSAAKDGYVGVSSDPAYKSLND